MNFLRSILSSSPPRLPEVKLPEGIRGILMVPGKDPIWIDLPVNAERAQLEIRRQIGVFDELWCVYHETGDRLLVWHDIGNANKEFFNAHGTALLGSDVYGTCVVISRGTPGTTAYDSAPESVMSSVTSNAKESEQSESEQPEPELKRVKVEDQPPTPPVNNSNTEHIVVPRKKQHTDTLPIRRSSRLRKH